MTGEGKSEREIAGILMIPASTVRRMKNGRVESPVIDDLPIPAHTLPESGIEASRYCTVKIGA